MMKKSIPIIILLLATALVISNFKHSNYKNDFKEAYKIYAITIPDTAYFAGERIPLERKHVKESFDRELLVNTYWQSQTLTFIKKANQFFPIIEPILKANKVPDDFKYLAVAESGLMNVVSPAQAVGFWQLLEGTAEDYGLEVNDVVDERYHVEKATEAACKYLQESYEKYGSWIMAAASYNTGRKGLDKQVDRQREDNYFNLMFDEETARYVFRLAVIKEILENPSEYGFHFRESDLYLPNEAFTVTVDTAIEHIADFNTMVGISYKELKYYNPWIRENYLHKTENKTYEIALPITLKKQFSER
jgi:membrane-bound lytic murein transglycosylase D